MFLSKMEDCEFRQLNKSRSIYYDDTAHYQYPNSVFSDLPNYQSVILSSFSDKYGLDLKYIEAVDKVKTSKKKSERR